MIYWCLLVDKQSDQLNISPPCCSGQRHDLAVDSHWLLQEFGIFLDHDSNLLVPALLNVAKQFLIFGYDAGNGSHQECNLIIINNNFQFKIMNIDQKSVFQQIKSSFKQFADKKSLREYYANYEHPQQQKNTYNFWHKILKYISSSRSQLFITKAKCLQMFEIYGMKPISLNKLIDIYINQEVLIPKNKLQSRFSQSKQNNNNVFAKIYNVFWSKSSQPINLQDQFTVKQVFEGLVIEAQKLLNSYSEKNRVSEYNQLTINLSNDLKISVEDVRLIIQILEFNSKIKLIEAQVQPRKIKLCFYGALIQNQRWRQYAQLEKTKYLLRTKISELDSISQERYVEIRNLYDKIKSLLHINDKATAKLYFKEKTLKQQSLGKIMTRKHIITTTLHQLEQAQTNKDIVQTLILSQEMIKSKQIDSEKWPDIKLNSDQIKQKLSEANDLYKSLANSQEEDLEVDKLFDQLQSELIQQHLTTKEPKVKVTVQIPSKPALQQQSKMLEQ